MSTNSAVNGEITSIVKSQPEVISGSRNTKWERLNANAVTPTSLVKAEPDIVSGSVRTGMTPGEAAEALVKKGDRAGLRELADVSPRKDPKNMKTADLTLLVLQRVKLFTDARPYIVELRRRFDALVDGDLIWGCSTWTQFCEDHLGISDRHARRLIARSGEENPAKKHDGSKQRTATASKPQTYNYKFYVIRRVSDGFLLSGRRFNEMFEMAARYDEKTDRRLPAGCEWVTCKATFEMLEKKCAKKATVRRKRPDAGRKGKNETTTDTQLTQAEQFKAIWAEEKEKNGGEECPECTAFIEANDGYTQGCGRDETVYFRDGSVFANDTAYTREEWAKQDG